MVHARPVEDELLSIGDFAARCGLSPKMLRSYARAGLLVPALVDASSGYRYYAPGQLLRARTIGHLRRAGISVADITAFFDDPDPAQFDRWDREIGVEMTARRHALDAARGAMGPAGRADRTAQPPTSEGVDMTTAIHAGTATDIGARDTNEDDVLIADGLFAIADGLGGLPAGEVASRLALDAMAAAFRSAPTTRGLMDACQEANRVVWRQGRAGYGEEGMGTTLAALAITSDAGAVVVHVGDSRLYRLRDGELERLTQDHTVVAELVRSGQLSESEAEDHPHRHVLTRAVGVAPEVDLEVARVSCQPGDRFLLCTDGVVKSLSSPDLKTLLAAASEPSGAASEVVAGAARRGIEDNATALVVDVG